MTIAGGVLGFALALGTLRLAPAPAVETSPLPAGATPDAAQAVPSPDDRPSASAGDTSARPAPSEGPPALKGNTRTPLRNLEREASDPPGDRPDPTGEQAPDRVEAEAAFKEAEAWERTFVPVTAEAADKYRRFASAHSASPLAAIARQRIRAIEQAMSERNTEVIPADGEGSSASLSGSGGGSVHVRGYYRKNGTYVQPHTRRSPRR